MMTAAKKNSRVEAVYSIMYGTKYVFAKIPSFRKVEDVRAVRAAFPGAKEVGNARLAPNFYPVNMYD